jgi:hypothetical protein
MFITSMPSLLIRRTSAARGMVMKTATVVLTLGVVLSACGPTVAPSPQATGPGTHAWRPGQVPYSTQAHADGSQSEALQRVGRLVADAGKRNWDELTAEYGAMLREGLGVMGTQGKHVNVLQHLRSTAPLAVMGFLKNRLASEGKQELPGLIEDYRKGLRR